MLHCLSAPTCTKVCCRHLRMLYKHSAELNVRQRRSQGNTSRYQSRWLHNLAATVPCRGCQLSQFGRPCATSRCWRKPRACTYPAIGATDRNMCPRHRFCVCGDRLLTPCKAHTQALTHSALRLSSAAAQPLRTARCGMLAFLSEH